MKLSRNGTLLHLLASYLNVLWVARAVQGVFDWISPDRQINTGISSFTSFVSNARYYPTAERLDGGWTPPLKPFPGFG